MTIHDYYCEKVLNGSIPIKKVYETENILAFHHSKPSFKVHIIIIPKVHSLDLLSFIEEDNEKLLPEMLSVVKKVIEKVTNENGGCRLTTNFGNCQQSKHLHWHVYVGDMMS